MSDRRCLMVSPVLVLGLSLSLCLGLVVLPGCGDSETGSVPEIKKSKKDLLGTEDGKVDPAAKNKDGRKPK